MRLCAANKMEYCAKLNERVLVEAHPRENNLVVKKKHAPKILQQIIATVQNEELVFTELGQHIIPQTMKEREVRFFSEYMTEPARHED